MSLKSLKERLERFRNADKVMPVQKRVAQYKVTSFVICIEIIACVLTGLMIGYFLDQWLSTGWFFKIACLILSFVANMVVLYRIISRD